jgi:hypothetical protein
MDLLDRLPAHRRRDLLIVLDTILRGVQKDRERNAEPSGG